MSTRIWYNKYETGYDNIKNQWMRAVPLGNGRVAAMFYGNSDTENSEYGYGRNTRYFGA